MNTPLTATQLNEQRASALRQRFREIRKIVKAAEAKDYTLLVPNLETISAPLQHQHISNALQTLMAESMKIIHELQPATTTGTKGKPKAANKEQQKAIVAGLSNLEL